MTFGEPILLGLLPVVLIVLTLTRSIQFMKRKRLHTQFPPHIRRNMQARQVPGLYVLRTVLSVSGLLLITFALARPQWGYTWKEAGREGLDLMVVIDTSNSMLADDFKPNRLQRAKWGVEEMVKRLKGDRIGLVAFAGEGVLQCPVTQDYGAFMMHLQDLFPGIVPAGGTNLESALQTAADAFDFDVESDKVILLITDGEQHTGNLDESLKVLEKNDIRVFAVGVGTTQGSLIPLSESSNGFLKNREDEVVKSTLDETPLRRLASSTGGLYLRATPTNFGIDTLVNQGLAPLKRTQLESEQVREMEERYSIFLAAGLAFLFFEHFSRIPYLLQRKPS